MDILLDTHMAYWFILGNEKIPRLARELISDCSNSVFVSLASAWEIGIKHAKRPDSVVLDADEFIEGCNEAGFVVLPITQDQILESMKIKKPDGIDHQDPFDRMLLGVSSAMRMRLLTQDHEISVDESACRLFD